MNQEKTFREWFRELRAYLEKDFPEYANPCIRFAKYRFDSDYDISDAGFAWLEFIKYDYIV